MSFQRKTEVKSRTKRYCCEHCVCWIEIGQPSLCIAEKFDGEFCGYRSHPECNDLAYEVFCWLDLGYDDWHGLIEELDDFSADEDPKGFKRRLAEIQAKYVRWTKESANA
jgi:hypothetical protein